MSFFHTSMVILAVLALSAFTICVAYDQGDIEDECAAEGCKHCKLWFSECRTDNDPGCTLPPIRVCDYDYDSNESVEVIDQTNDPMNILSAPIRMASRFIG